MNISPPTHKKAATVILLRKKEPLGYEVFLPRRNERDSFMTGKFVYPGGKVDQENCLKELIPWISAIRRHFEEAGILLGYNQMGTPIHFPNTA